MLSGKQNAKRFQRFGDAMGMDRHSDPVTPSVRLVCLQMALLRRLNFEQKNGKFRVFLPEDRILHFGVLADGSPCGRI
jgi:hypothetical protein